MADLWKDVRFALRLMAKARWFAVAAIVPLALGIGANTTVFTITNAVLLRDLPIEDPERVMYVWSDDFQGIAANTSFPDYRDWRDQSRSFTALASILTSTINISGEGGGPERTQGAYITPEFFGMVGIRPILGRDFVAADNLPGAEPVALISHAIWVSRHDSDPGVLGATIRLNGIPATVVGVMPPDMRFPNTRDIWIPHVQLPPATAIENRTARNFQVFGRLADGVTVDQARTELREIAERISEVFPITGYPNLEPYQERVTRGDFQTLVRALMGAVAFVLMIACANVANLLLARSQDRAQEVSVRVAHGATRGRVVRQLLVESLLLSVAAGVLGLGLAMLGIRWFEVATVDQNLPYWMSFSLDGTVFAFIAAVCLSAAVVFGLAPALHVSGTDVNAVLKEGTRGGSGGVGSRRWASALVVGEIALTLVLLSGAGFMMRSFLSLYRMDVGIQTDDLVAVSLYIPLTQYPAAALRSPFYQAFDDRLGEAPGLQGHAMASVFPLSGGEQRYVEIQGETYSQDSPPPFTTIVMVNDGYFDAYGIPMLEGRPFERGDGTPGRTTAIVNQRFADLFLGGGDALGRMVRSPTNFMTISPVSWLTVVGVVPNIRQVAIQDDDPDPILYLPLRADPVRNIFMAVRTPGGVGTAMPAVHAAMAGLNPDIPFFDFMPMEDVLAEQQFFSWVFGLMFSVFAGIALVLSAVGVYSVTAYTVAQRTREMGIRAALGAAPPQLIWLVLRKNLLHLAIAVAIGLGGALYLGQVLQAFLVQMSPAEPTTLVGTVLLLFGVVLAASVVPSRRAARVDPMVALRVE